MTTTPILDAHNTMTQAVIAAGFRDFPEFGVSWQDFEANINALEKIKKALDAFAEVLGREAAKAGADLTEFDTYKVTDALCEDLLAAMNLRMEDLIEGESRNYDRHRYAYGGDYLRRA